MAQTPIRKRNGRRNCFIVFNYLNWNKLETYICNLLSKCSWLPAAGDLHVKLLQSFFVYIMIKKKHCLKHDMPKAG
jgi:hypothetical protein